jgi:hypothetical protein
MNFSLCTPGLKPGSERKLMDQAHHRFPFAAINLREWMLATYARRWRKYITNQGWGNFGKSVRIGFTTNYMRKQIDQGKRHYRLISIKRNNQNYSYLNGIPGEIFDKIAVRFPQYLAFDTHIKVDLPVGHPDLDELLSFARDAGARISRHGHDTTDSVVIYDRQNWTQKEIDASPLLEVWSRNAVQLAELEQEWGAEGTIYRVLKERRLKNHKDKEFGGTGGISILLMVRGGMKQRLEQAGLRGLVLRLLEMREGDWPVDIEPLYRVSSDITLPPMQNLLSDNDGKVFPSRGNQGPHPRGAYILDGYETCPRPRYLRSEVDPESFDVAITYERLLSWGQQSLIVSQRFRAVCKELKLKLEWSPVIVE